MKILSSRKLKQVAGSLLVALVTVSVFSLFVAYYLSLTEQQVSLNARSQAWNMAIAITEAGIEEGLEQLNSNLPNLASDNWTYISSSQCYYRTNSLGSGSGYAVFLTVTNLARPVIVAKAYVQPPGLARNTIPDSCFFATAAWGATVTPAPLARAVRVTCGKPNMYANVLAVKSDIDMHGNGMYTDSYNSLDPTKSTDGKYDASKYSGDKGDVATDGSLTNMGYTIDYVSIQNANIYGKVHLGPNCTVSIGSNGGVGPHGAQAGDVPTAVSKGYIVQDACFTFPDTTLPNAAGWPMPSSGFVVTNGVSIHTNANNSATYPGSGSSNVGTNGLYVTGMPLPADPSTYYGAVPANGGHDGKWNYYIITGYSWNTYQTNKVYGTNFYDHILFGNTNYFSPTNLTGGTMVLGPNTTLVLSNGLNQANGDSITFATAGTNVLYAFRSSPGTVPTNWTSLYITNPPTLLANVGGTSLDVTCNQVINPSGFAASLVVWCAPTVTSVSFTGNGIFTGVLVAPFADLSLNGGGHDYEDFCGSIMAKSARLNGHFRFHWDEALGTAASNGRYLANSWNEISPY